MGYFSFEFRIFWIWILIRIFMRIRFSVISIMTARPCSRWKAAQHYVLLHRSTDASTISIIYTTTLGCKSLGEIVSVFFFKSIWSPFYSLHNFTHQFCVDLIKILVVRANISTKLTKWILRHLKLHDLPMYSIGLQRQLPLERSFMTEQLE